MSAKQRHGRRATDTPALFTVEEHCGHCGMPVDPEESYAFVAYSVYPKGMWGHTFGQRFHLVCPDTSNNATDLPYSDDTQAEAVYGYRP